MSHCLDGAVECGIMYVVFINSDAKAVEYFWTVAILLHFTKVLILFNQLFFLNLISYHVLANYVNYGLKTIGVVLAQLKHQLADHKKRKESWNRSIFTNMLLPPKLQRRGLVF